MNKYCQRIGKKGEVTAVQYCRRLGYLVINTHYTSRWGEIDIIAKDGDEIVFIEVKSRTTKLFGEPEESITKEKLARLTKTIAVFLFEHPEILEYRIDVIVVLFWSSILHPSIEHIKRIEFLTEKNGGNEEFDI